MSSATLATPRSKLDWNTSGTTLWQDDALQQRIRCASSATAASFAGVGRTEGLHVGRIPNNLTVEPWTRVGHFHKGRQLRTLCGTRIILLLWP